MILSVAMLLQWLGEHRGDAVLLQAGDAVSAAVDAVLSHPASRTADLGGTMGTEAFGAAVAARLDRA